MRIIIGIILFYIIIPVCGQDYIRIKKPFNNSQTIIIDDVFFHYRTWKNNPKKTKKNKYIFFIHGLFGNTQSFRHNYDTLIQQGYNIISVDLPAFGYSDRRCNINQSTGNRAQLLWKLLNTLYPKQQWHLIGHSMGGGVVEAMGILNPKQTKSIILIDGTVFKKTMQYKSSIMWFFAQYPIKQIMNSIAKKYFINYKYIEKTLSSAYGEKPDSIAVTSYLYPLKIKGTVFAFLASFYNTKEQVQLHIDSIKSPILAIWGKEDIWISYKIYGKLIETHINEYSITIIDNAAHCPMETHAKKTNIAITNFLIKHE